MENLNSGTILVVDDEFDVLDQVISALSDAFPAFKLLNASNGEKALEIMEHTTPDLVLTDWEMPQLSGFRLLQLMQTNPRLKEVPIIVMSGKKTASTDLEQALDAGSTDYLRKPIDLIELKARVRSIFRLKAIQEQNQAQQEKIQVLLTQEKNRLEEELQTKSRKLSTTALIDLEKNKLLQEIELTFNAISPQLSKNTDLYRHLNTLKRQLKQVIRLDNSWDDFKLHFEEVHPSFFKKLEMISEGLTIQEIKLAAYLKLGMGTKEIAHLLNIAPDSARKSVYRLKKKFNIEGGDDNFRTFMLELA